MQEKYRKNILQFSVKSRCDPDAVCRVDMAMGTCTCVCARDGSPCSHQLAVTIHYHVSSLNCLIHLVGKSWHTLLWENKQIVMSHFILLLDNYLKSRKVLQLVLH